MPSHVVIVVNPRADDGMQRTECVRVEKQRSVLALEPAIERLHLRIVPRPAECIRHPEVVFEQEPGRQGVAGEDGVLIMVNDQGLQAQAMSQERLPGSLPALQRQTCVGMFPHRPAQDQLCGVVDEGHQVRFAPAVGVDQLGEVGVGNLEGPDRLLASHQVDAVPGHRDRPADPARFGRFRAPNQGQIPGLMQPLHHLVVDTATVGFPQLHCRPAIAVFRMLAGDGLQRLPQVLVLVRVAHFLVLMVVPRGARQAEGGQNGGKPAGLTSAPHQRHLLLGAHPFRPKKFLSRAISTSFLPSNCSSSARRRSYCWTVPSWAKTSAPRSRNSFFHSPTEFGWMPYCLAIWPGVFSPLSASSTTWNFNFGEYCFLLMANGSFLTSPGRSLPQLPKTSTPHDQNVQDSGVSTLAAPDFTGAPASQLHRCAQVCGCSELEKQRRPPQYAPDTGSRRLGSRLSAHHTDGDQVPQSWSLSPSLWLRR